MSALFFAPEQHGAPHLPVTVQNINLKSNIYRRLTHCHWLWARIRSIPRFQPLRQAMNRKFSVLQRTMVRTTTVPKSRSVLSLTSRFLESGGSLPLNGLPSPFVLVDFVKRLYKNTLAKGDWGPVKCGNSTKTGKVGMRG